MEQHLDQFPVDEPTNNVNREQNGTRKFSPGSPAGSEQGKKIIDVACWPCRKRKGKAMPPYPS
ncbi:uncharacterized protein RCC_10588 [Ramularia collo-cygni]|uniref:Uncharacterized protein n=1 Tax=Ramularia collo-cygni TaxID=112498 RepID=A0A2D3VCT9_9PEZI|nr:uncharacterized protein RCC_10588 [Ramularia collo-cygni]CZT24860.1 uncharacterized protein RCC_10588 [Ramularia collo-cygni]